MRNKHEGTTRNAATFSKSSLSLEITPILDQSPLYLHINPATLFTLKKKVTKFEINNLVCLIYPASMNPSPNTATTDLATIVFETLNRGNTNPPSWVLEISVGESLLLAIMVPKSLPFFLTNRESQSLLKMRLFPATNIFPFPPLLTPSYVPFDRFSTRVQQ